MDFSKIKNKLLICLCCVVLILPFYLITFSYADDTISGIVLNGIGYSSSYETGEIVTLTTVYNAYGIYFPVKAGYSYVLSGDFVDTQYYRMFTTEVVPDVDVSAVGMYLGYNPNNYTFTATTDGYLFIWNYQVPITNDNTNFSTLGGMTDSISSLVDNVGINSIWNIFDISINYIVIVVLVAFGIYIIFRIIRKISRGKEGL